MALGPDEADAFVADAGTLVDNYFRLGGPQRGVGGGIELGVETVVDGMRLRGIIDRLDVTPDGDLIVVDYKTGRAPSERFERGSMGGVQTYALLVREPARAGPGRGPAALPAPTRYHLVGTLGADRPGPAPARRRRVVGHRAGLRRRGLPTPRQPVVQPLPLQDVLPRLRRVTPARGEHHRRGGRRRLRTPPGPPGDRPRRRGRLQPGRLRVRLGLARPGSGRGGGTGPRRAVVGLAAAGFSSLLVSRVVKAAVERQRPVTTSRSACAPRPAAASRADTPSPPSARRSSWAIRRPARPPTSVSPPRWRSAGSTSGPITPPTSSGSTPSDRCSAWACARSSTSSRPAARAGGGADVADGEMRSSEVVLKKI